MWLERHRNLIHKLFVLLVLRVYAGCEAITNADFNAQIRDYSVVENNVNLTDVKTLQKHGPGLSRYANLAPVQNPVKFKYNDDNAISESSHARGLLHHAHTGYGFDYEDPNFGHGYDYSLHDGHHEAHDYNHYDFHDSGHHHHLPHHGYGHHKYYDHGLAHKALLWPIAGIALLGAAAALVTNPVLLQLGVVSGKRRRRHVEDIENIAKNSIQKWTQITRNYENANNIAHEVVKKRMLRRNDFKVGKRVLEPSNSNDQFETIAKAPLRHSEEDQRFIPIPLKYKKS